MRYVEFRDLDEADQMTAQMRYLSRSAYLPTEQYQYPVLRNGRLAMGRRHMPADRAKRLYHEHIMKEVHDS